ncbi:photosystem I assembly protein Ycf3 [Planctomycetes bacterium Pla86]|nr:photosystem I assembly protein Ycf3 [Planctomycetes bacterium Pla86]
MSHYIEGIKAFGAGDHAAAVEHYDRALEIDPDNTEVLNAKSMSLMNLERFDEAIAVGQRVVELDPDDAMIHTSLSIIYQRMGKIDEAEAEAAHHRLKSWRQELKRNPGAPPPPEAGGINVIQ